MANPEDPAKSYLLGKLRDEAQVEFEERMFSDDDRFFETLTAEYDLTDQFVRASLSRSDASAFRQHLLKEETEQARIAVAQSLVACFVPSRPRRVWKASSVPAGMVAAAILLAVVVLGRVQSGHRPTASSSAASPNPPIARPLAVQASRQPVGPSASLPAEPPATSAPEPAAPLDAGDAALVNFAVLVTDASGVPIPNVNITLSGAADRVWRTGAGRMAFEGLPAGAYLFRFDKDGYVPLERELTASGTTPIDVKATLSDMALPPVPAASVTLLPSPPDRPVRATSVVDAVLPRARLKSHLDVSPMALDLPAYIRRNYGLFSFGEVTGLTCTTGGGASLLFSTFSLPIGEHTHPDSDEFIYVIAGEGNARIAGAFFPMHAGMFLVVPRGILHSMTATREPLAVLSMVVGDKCS